jgi:hypothetical protein
MSLPQDGSRDDGGNLTLGIALNRGISLGAHFVGVYGSDCDDPVEAQVLAGAAARMLAD